MKRASFPFLLGFLSISIQILLLREFCSQFYGNEVVIGFVLGSWLLWGSLGSLLASRLKLPLSSLPWLFHLSLFLAIIIFSGLRLSRFIWGADFGESMGIGPAFFSALFCCAFLSFPFGLLFFLNVKSLNGDISFVYIWESLGAAAGGIIVHLLLIPHLSCWQSIAGLGFFSLFLLTISYRRRNFLISSGLILTLLIAFTFLDFPSQKKVAFPFSLIQSVDSRFGRLQLIRLGDQVTLYQDGLVISSLPDPAAAEEIVHFAMLQRPEACHVLLLGGGTGEALREILQYPNSEVDYVEIDPYIIQLMKPFLSTEGRASLASPRLNIFHVDGRAFLQKTTKIYEVIILAVPEPATAQLNRFYTREFFGLIKKHLSAGGLLSLRVSSAENYQSPTLRLFLNTLYQTLSSVFNQIQVIPGETNIFLASDGIINLDLDYFSSVLKKYRIETRFIRPEMLFARLDPRRLANWKERVLSQPEVINLDLRPRGYFYFTSFWASQFKSVEARIFNFFHGLSPSLLTLAPVLIILALFLPLFLQQRKKAWPALPLLILGFTTMMAETIVLLWFQTKFGYIYEQMALLIACFMLGLSAGASLGRKSTNPDFRYIFFDQIALIFLLFGLWFLLPLSIPEFIPYLILFLLGLAGGHLFIVSNAPLMAESGRYGLGYGLDLAGSFLGAVLGASIFFPLLGLVNSTLSLLLLNFLGFLAFIPFIIRRK